MKPAQNIVDAFENREAPVKINLVTSGVTAISEKDIVQGTFEITRSCGSQGIGFGSATAAELRFTLDNKSQKWDKVKFNGKEFTLTMSCNMERFTCGYYTVDQVTRHKNTIEVVALDRMCRFDKPVDWSKFNKNETPSSIISKSAVACSVLYAGNISGWTNGSRTFNTENIVDRSAMTYRQLIQYALQLMCAFAIIELDGTLVVKQLNTESVYTISDDKLYSYEVAEEPIKVSGFKFQYGDTKNPTVTYSGTNDEYCYDLSRNPFVQTEKIPSQWCSPCWGHWNALPPMYGFEAQVEPIPWIMPGDMVTIKEWRGASIKSFVTSVTIGLNIGTKIACTVDNYVRKYAAGSGLSSNQIRILNQIESSSNQAKEEANLLATNFNEVLSGSIGLKHTVLDGKDYWYNGDNIYTSTVVYTFNDGGFAWTDSYTGTSTVWKYGATRDGNAILNYLTVNKLTADQITAGSITSNLLASTYKNEVTQEIKDETSHYLLKTEYESGITQSENNIKLWVRENQTKTNPNLVLNSYDPVVWKGSLVESCQIIDNPSDPDPMLRKCYRAYKPASGSTAPFTSNWFPYDPTSAYTVSFYVGKYSDNVDTIAISLILSTSTTHTNMNFQASLPRNIPVSDINNGMVTYTFSANESGSTDYKTAYVQIGPYFPPSNDVLREIYINKIKVEKGDNATPWTENDSAVSDIYSMINISKDSIELSVKNYSTPNLLVNSANPKTQAAWVANHSLVTVNNYTYIRAAATGSTNPTAWIRMNRFPFDANKAYTLSFNVYRTSNLKNIRVGIFPHVDLEPTSKDAYSNGFYENIPDYTALPKTPDGRYYYRFRRFGPNAPEMTDSNYFSYKSAYITIRIDAEDGKSGYVDFDKLKLEENDKGSAWTDVTTAGSLQSLLKITQDEILIQSKNIRLAAETLVWEADNSSLTETGHLTATSAEFDKCDITNCVATELKIREGIEIFSEHSPKEAYIDFHTTHSISTYDKNSSNSRYDYDVRLSYDNNYFRFKKYASSGYNYADVYAGNIVSNGYVEATRFDIGSQTGCNGLFAVNGYSYKFVGGILVKVESTQGEWG